MQWDVGFPVHVQKKLQHCLNGSVFHKVPHPVRQKEFIFSSLNSFYISTLQSDK